MSGEALPIRHPLYICLKCLKCLIGCPSDGATLPIPTNTGHPVSLLNHSLCVNEVNNGHQTHQTHTWGSV
jgi:hypothetical protein